MKEILTTKMCYATKIFFGKFSTAIHHLIIKLPKHIVT